MPLYGMEKYVPGVGTYYIVKSGTEFWTLNMLKDMHGDTFKRNLQYLSDMNFGYNFLVYGSYNNGYGPSSDIAGYSSGIENGPVTYTGLAMLHGSPSSPEYVLNSEQAGTLLKNLATMTLSPYKAPVVDSYSNNSKSVVYQFNGDMNLPNVQRPDQFFNELLK
jgi:hypothetical protein